MPQLYQRPQARTVLPVHNPRYREPVEASKNWHLITILLLLLLLILLAVIGMSLDESHSDMFFIFLGGVPLAMFAGTMGWWILRGLWRGWWERRRREREAVLPRWVGGEM
ncbi:hypothetical protein FN846DRAFT_923882 [Sphaerosporella brunnea]|uniref:Uncharacterized protein n=1 Tax=Sphaerosporella brunnea TaxID=1250544 RepID=A0A5J5ECX8_9PEZI|nr:hypothetical protein FN846DRAFT_923882 [Sphaerosporella brunnea]